MKTIYVVDSDAAGLTADFNGIAKASTFDVAFLPFPSPEQLFDALESSIPDLILLHHNWQGLTISQLLQRIIDLCPETRVIVFTGRAIKIGELIECVRFGVADYWTKQSLDPMVGCRQILHYCSNVVWTLKSLRMPSGSLQQLLQEVEVAVQSNSSLVRANEDLTERLQTSTNEVTQEVRKAKLTVAKFGGYIALLTAATIALKTWTDISQGVLVAIVTILALFCLFAEGRLSEAFLDWRKGRAHVRGNGK